jgi:hypothetical protein
MIPLYLNESFHVILIGIYMTEIAALSVILGRVLCILYANDDYYLILERVTKYIEWMFVNDKLKKTFGFIGI